MGCSLQGRSNTYAKQKRRLHERSVVQMNRFQQVPMTKVEVPKKSNSCGRCGWKKQIE